MVCVHKGPVVREEFHRQDFFFFNFAYSGDYGAISHVSGNHIVVRENECYIGQPFSGYALYAQSEKDITIVGVLIRKDVFFQSFLPVLAISRKFFNFFLHPQEDEYADYYIHFKLQDYASTRNLLEIMIVEYAHPQRDTQAMLESMTLTLMLQIARQYAAAGLCRDCGKLSVRIIQYITQNLRDVTLTYIARRFGYHPNYISTQIRKESGKPFSQILLQLRMERAAALLKCTDLPIDRIAAMLGYTTGNFYRAFKCWYGRPPRELI